MRINRECRTFENHGSDRCLNLGGQSPSAGNEMPASSIDAVVPRRPPLPLRCITKAAKDDSLISRIPHCRVHSSAEHLAR